MSKKETKNNIRKKPLSTPQKKQKTPTVEKSPPSTTQIKDYYTRSKTLLAHMDNLEEQLFDMRILLDTSLQHSNELEALLPNSNENTAIFNPLILDTLFDAVFIFDKHHQYHFANKAAIELFQLTRNKLKDSSIQDIFRFEPELASILTALSESNIHHHASQYKVKQQAIQTLSQWRYIPTNTNQTYLVITFKDITKESQYQSQFYQSQRMESLGLLVSGIAHDMSNIITPIHMGIESLKQTLNTKDKNIQMILSILENSTEQGKNLIQQILSFAKGNELALSPSNIQSVINDVHQLITKTFPSTIDIQVKYPEILPSINANNTQLNQVLLNLCLNAKDAMSNSGCLTISSKETYIQTHKKIPKGHYIQVSIKDTGKGMSKKESELIFDPFYSTKPKEKGTGLGLSAVLSIINSHQGFIEVQSKPQKHTQFDIYLPIPIC